jgi:hypothetical protein
MEETTRLFGDAAAAGRDTVSTSEAKFFDERRESANFPN